MDSILKVGFGQFDITPVGKASLYGQFFLRFTEEIHSRLQATAIWIEAQNQRTVWVSCDLLEIVDILQKEVYECIKKNISDFKPEQLVLSATHVHTAPFFSDRIQGFGSLESFWSNDKAVMTPEKYRLQLVEGIAKAVLEAHEKLENCYIETAVSRIQTGYCRRVTYKDGSAVMYGAVNTPDFAGLESHDGGPVNLLYVRRSADKALTGVIANVPCPAQVLEGKYAISSDYWGYVRKFIAESLGENVKVLGLSASAGDLSPRDLLASVAGEPDIYEDEGCRALARRISDEIIRLSNYPVAVCNAGIIHKHKCTKLKLPVWKSTKAEYEQALNILSMLDKQYNLSADSYKFPEEMTDVCGYARAEVSKLRYEEDMEYKECMVHGVRLGNVVLISNPFELFIEYADRIRAACAGIHLFDVQLSCDFLGYLPTRKAIQGGGYSACIDNGLTTPDGGELLVRESIKLVKSLF